MKAGFSKMAKGASEAIKEATSVDMSEVEEFRERLINDFKDAVKGAGHTAARIGLRRDTWGAPVCVLGQQRRCTLLRGWGWRA